MAGRPGGCYAPRMIRASSPRPACLRLGARAAACALLLASAGPVRAAPLLPSLDTDALCAMRLRRDATLLVADCVAAEQRALEDLRPAYATVPARVRSRCERLSRRETGGIGSYAFIQGCLDLK